MLHIDWNATTSSYAELVKEHAYYIRDQINSFYGRTRLSIIDIDVYDDNTAFIEFRDNHTRRPDEHVLGIKHTPFTVPEEVASDVIAGAAG